MLLRGAKIFVFSLIFCLAFIPLKALAKDKTPNSYENTALGVKITGPHGWFITPGEKVQQNLTKRVEGFTSSVSLKEALSKVGVLVIFSQYQFDAPVEYNPNVTLVTEPVSSSYTKSVMDYANASLINIKKLFKDVKVIENPKIVKLNGKKVAHFVYEGSMVKGYLEIRLESSAYFFLKNELGYALTCTDEMSNFNKNAAKFKKATNSFKIK